MWNTNDELVGERILIDCGYDEEEATVLAVSTTSARIKVLTDDGDVMVGDQWEEV